MSEPEIVHVAVYDTLADWEHGYAVAHIARASGSGSPGAICTVGLGPDPVTTMGGVTIVPDTTLESWWRLFGLNHPAGFFELTGRSPG